MKNTFTKCEKPITDADVALIEMDLGVRLPNDLVTHYKKCNGGTPRNSIWKDPSTKWVDSEVGNFISLKYRKGQADDPDFTIEGIAKKFWSSGKLQRNHLPFARDYGTNFFCIDINTAEIFFVIVDPWNHVLRYELHSGGGTRFVANTLGEFIEGLVFNDEDE